MNLLGRIAYIIIWPALWAVAPLTRRVRIVISYKNKVLLVKHWIGPGSWQLPGGGIKRGESIINAAQRELGEELGLKLEKVKIIEEGPRTVRSNHTTWRLHFVESKAPKECKIKTNWEIIEYQWFEVEKLPDIPVEVKIALDLAFKRVKT